MPRLRRVSSSDPGWRRLRSGRGFRYVDAGGESLPQEAVTRARELVIPPAWTDVWICADECGHLQAVGTDAAGRRQYLYHPAWRAKRDAVKFDRALQLGERLPLVRRRLSRLMAGEATSRDAVLAAAVRLVDLGCFRPGAVSYAEDNGSHGLTTLLRRHVRRAGKDRVFEFVGKAGIEHEIHVGDPSVARVVDRLARGRRDVRLLRYADSGKWHDVDPAMLNEFIRDVTTLDVTAKDFRTWHATALAAAVLTEAGPARSERERAKRVRAAAEEVAELLGNTPTVARGSYIDPRVIDLYEQGKTLERMPRGENALDRAVAELLGDG